MFTSVINSTKLTLTCFQFSNKKVGHFKKRFITNLVNENGQHYGTSGHDSDNTVIINDTLCVHPSKHKGQSYCL